MIKGLILKKDEIASNTSIFMCRMANQTTAYAEGIDNGNITHIMGSPLHCIGLSIISLA